MTFLSQGTIEFWMYRKQ